MAASAGLRSTTMTEKGKSLYDECVASYQQKLINISKQLDIVSCRVTTAAPMERNMDVRDHILQLQQEYNCISREFESFLKRQNHQEANDELSRQTVINNTTNSKIETVLNQIESQSVIREKAHSTSQRSRRSATSRLSTKSADQLLIDFETKRANLMFAEREKLLKLEKAAMEEEAAVISARCARRRAVLSAEIDLLTDMRGAACAEACANLVRDEKENPDSDTVLSYTSDDRSPSRTAVPQPVFHLQQVPAMIQADGHLHGMCGVNMPPPVSDVKPPSQSNAPPSVLQPASVSVSAMLQTDRHLNDIPITSMYPYVSDVQSTAQPNMPLPVFQTPSTMLQAGGHLHSMYSVGMPPYATAAELTSRLDATSPAFIPRPITKPPFLPDSHAMQTDRVTGRLMGSIPPPYSPDTYLTLNPPTVGTTSAMPSQQAARSSDGQPTLVTVHQSAKPVTMCSDTHMSHEPPPKVTASINTAWSSSADALTTYLARKDLNLARFSKFNDDPANFSAWKNSFKNITKEFHVRPDEEIDLLVKWLGPGSSKQVLSLRTSNSHDFAAGLKKIWERLDARYGAPELIENSLKTKVNKFPRVSPKDYSKLYDLEDLLREIESLKTNPTYTMLLSYYDTSAGANAVIAKLPPHLQSKWIAKAVKYKANHQVPFPPFSYLLDFVKECATTFNDPAFRYNTYDQDRGQRSTVSTSRHEVLQTKKTSLNAGNETKGKCHLHPQYSHKLSECKQFMKKLITERRRILKEKGICFRCCDGSHEAKNCTTYLKCAECGSNNHPTSLHIPAPKNKEKLADATLSRNNSTNDSAKHHRPEEKHGGEQVNTKCTAVCGGSKGRSCAKVLPVKIYSKEHPDKCVEAYAILDDQSNCSLASPDLLNALDAHGEEVDYTLSSCSGKFKASGRKVFGYIVESVDGSYSRQLPPLIECTDIPNDTSEIATPEVVQHFDHLKNVPIPRYRQDCQIGLLIGRDAPDLHQVREQVIGQRNMPFAQRLGLGWVIVGEVCLGKVHKPEVHVLKTSILQDGRGTIFPPCENCLNLKEDIFFRTENDNKLGLSREDKEFLAIMDEETYRSEEGNWISPLPFRTPKSRLPNNRAIALKRARILDSTLQKNEKKRQHFVAFMEKVLKSGAAEIAPPAEDGEVWYLPIFGVYHPQKPDQIRGVFDSSAEFQGVSLNKCLLPGPNLMNDLLGILLRFRKDQFAVAADVEQMFYSFLVRADHRDFLRFLWYKDNDPKQQLVEYRMRAHVFGNSPSPAVASYGLRKCVETKDVPEDVMQLVTRDFYVDDALTSRPSAEESISLVQRTQKVLKEKGNLRLHKVVSNSSEVISAFPVEDRAKEIKTLRLDQDPLPTHRSLGMLWDMNSDSFKYQIAMKGNPDTRRSMLSYLNSIYDPLGFAAPITIHGKILLREITKGYSWDDKVEAELEERWKDFEESVRSLQELDIPRMIIPASLSLSEDHELHVFCDASEQAICSVIYMKSHFDGHVLTGFVIGKAKVAPLHGHTIPRLELCAALLASELVQTVTENLGVTLKAVHFYSDSKVVLGYIHNKTRRFHTYVSNRVERILRHSSADQWNYISTKNNPADMGTRALCTLVDVQERWLQAPKMLNNTEATEKVEFQLVSPDEDKEIRVEVRKLAVEQTHTSFSNRFERFSNWSRLVSALRLIKGSLRGFKVVPGDESNKLSADLYTETERVVLELHQKEQFSEELKCLQNNKPVPAKSPISSLYPVLDPSGILRVGGRLSQGSFSSNETHPVIISGKTHMAKLLVRHFHEKCRHQGRILTETTMRNNGYWITSAKRLISQVIHKCVVCRRLRAETGSQKMADLPVDRLTPAPPFTYVGVDAFGPWSIVTRKTRGGSANSKRWAILFTCLGSRAVHIELVEEMSTSSFLNALRRLVAIRGDVKELRSDNGTNFVGAAQILRRIDPKLVWKFNPPHSSHMGGVWERMIGIARRILDAMLLDVMPANLTHEVLSTFMAEVGAIMNSRPIAPLSTDPEMPMILSPSLLLTQKPDNKINSCDFSIKDMYREQWKRVQALSDMFWKRWREGYLQTLQRRRKWRNDIPDLKNGDIVLMKDKNIPRKEWATCVVTNAIKSDSDNKVRKAEVRVYKDGSNVSYVRPVTDLVTLIEV